jgi:hypothetical protein
MKLPSFKRIFDTDFDQQYKSMIQTLSATINIGFEVVYEALNKKISLSENIQCTLKDITLIVDATGRPTTRIAFSSDIPNMRVVGTQVIKITNLKNSNSYPTGGIFVTYVETNTGIEIQHVTGLIAGDTYLLRIVAYH